MRRGIIVQGLGFGDEGKGATVDFLTRELSAELVVRYCGGSQAATTLFCPMDGATRFRNLVPVHSPAPPRILDGR